MRHILLLSAAALVIAACGGSGDSEPDASNAPAPAQQSAPIEEPAAAVDDAAMTETPTEEAPSATEEAIEAAADEAETDMTAALAALPAPYNEADLANGNRQFRRCASCHTIAEGARNLVGPNLHGLFSRNAGEVEGFSYSAAVRDSGIDWSPEHLDSWLQDPRGYIPGNRMSFVGLREANDRRDVIAYLMIETAAE
ncbi:MULTISPECIES: c-type cytochrome [Hyphobacterium]|uniref:Cytochrome c family protein n=1 Tax=Hyphobacterium vulgare TaxID=1736751 RepID=A0ABV6ZU61_9PROT